MKDAIKISIILMYFTESDLQKYLATVWKFTEYVSDYDMGSTHEIGIWSEGILLLSYSCCFKDIFLNMYILPYNFSWEIWLKCLLLSDTRYLKNIYGLTSIIQIINWAVFMILMSKLLEKTLIHSLSFIFKNSGKSVLIEI